eukprot:13787660-Alexandrium_andersonii.AAC.1
MPASSAAAHSEARPAGTTAVLTLQAHSVCHSVQAIQGAKRRKASMLTPVTVTPPRCRRTRN